MGGEHKPSSRLNLRWLTMPLIASHLKPQSTEMRKSRPKVKKLKTINNIGGPFPTWAALVPARRCVHWAAFYCNDLLICLLLPFRFKIDWWSESFYFKQFLHYSVTCKVDQKMWSFQKKKPAHKMLFLNLMIFKICKLYFTSLWSWWVYQFVTLTQYVTVA